MALKNNAKKIIPPQFRPIARSLYCLMIMPQYYFHYFFGGGRANYPLRAKFELNYHDNQACLMCHPFTEKSHQDSLVQKKQQTENELTTEEILQVIDDLSGMGVKEITLRGDEPFLRKDLFDIIAHIKKNQLDCTIISTDILIDESQAKKLIEHRVDNLILSLDGNQQTHNRIHNMPNSFQNLMSSVSFINDAKKISRNKYVSLLFTCMVSSINVDQLSELMDIAYRYEADMHYGHLHYTTDKMLQQTSSIIETEDVENENQNIYEKLKHIDVEKLKNELKNIKKKQKKYNIEVNLQPHLKGDEIRKYYFNDKFSYASKCFYPWYSLRIYPYGEVHPCAMTVCIGNVRNTSIKDIWNNEKFIDFRKQLRQQGIFPKCTKCCALNTKLWSYLPRFPFKYN